MPVVIAVVLFALITIASIWILSLAWLLAVVGILLMLIAIAPKARVLVWPGAALVAAPIANAFVLMPILRQFMH
ncbi:MAG TPA: hypothetical protein VJ654_17165 [Noviherbaspirillum sp.]|nr:hypothetical protein [Noviherbaspirillum sp.]